MSVGDASQHVDSLASELLFCTPVFRRVLPDADRINPYLRELFLSRERSATRESREYSNVGGWHSPIDLQETWDRDLRLVLERSRELATEATNRLLGPAARPHFRYALSAWANVSRQGDYNVPHVHPSTWSAVYYVSVPQISGADPREGGLELMDPRSATAMIGMPGPFFATRYLIKPEPGLMVLFPASIMHLVHPFRGEGERISIACDLTLET